MTSQGSWFAQPGHADVLVGRSAQAGEGASAYRHAPGWYSRGYLPHVDGRDLLQAVTFRLSDSLPNEKLRLLRDQLSAVPENLRDAARRKKIEQWLDAGIGCCALAHPSVARHVHDSLLYFHGVRYHLHAWCVMPNHIHVLVEPLTDLASIVQSWKSFTSCWVMRNCGSLDLQVPKSGRLWMRDYWDRYIRDEHHYRQVVDYIHQNPVKAGLCASAGAWPWSSAADVLGETQVVVGRRALADEDVGVPGNARSRNLELPALPGGEAGE